MKSKQMKIYEDYLNMLVEGHVNSVLCYSKAGLGKTYTTIKLLKKMGVTYTYNSGVSTAVSLYKIFHDNSDKVIILDDIETIFQDERVINLLKAGLWEVDGKRILSYKTTSKTLEDYPETFEFTGRIIILANEIKGRYDESFKALMSRCLKYELTYSFQEIIEISYKMIEEREDINDKEKTQVNNIIYNTISPEHNFNFRLLERLVAFVKYDSGKAEELFLNSLDVDEETEIVMDILRRYTITNDQISAYQELTGRSRMTFFRKKKKLKAEGLI